MLELGRLALVLIVLQSILLLFLVLFSIILIFLIFVFRCKFAFPSSSWQLLSFRISYYLGAVTLMMGGDTISPFVMFSSSVVCVVMYQSVQCFFFFFILAWLPWKSVFTLKGLPRINMK